MADPSHQPSFSDEELETIAKEKIVQRLAVRSHVAAYLAVNVGLLVINYLTNALAVPWFAYPLVGWLIGLVAHVTYYALYARGVTGASFGVIINGAVYAVASLSLAVINIVSNPAYPWYLWPLVFWGLGVVIHAIAVRAFAPRQEPSGEKKSWLDRSVQKELDKAKTRGGA